MIAPKTDRLRGRRAVEQRARRLSSHPLCAHCLKAGRIQVATEVDHVVPLHMGGPDTDENTQNLCHDCHTDKSNRDAGNAVKVQVGLDGWPVG